MGTCRPEIDRREGRGRVMAECKYCGEYVGELTCGGVIIAPSSPINTALICDECEDRAQDWFHDSDMEDR